MARPHHAPVASGNSGDSNTSSRQKCWQRVRFCDVVQNVNTTCSNPCEAGLERYVGLEHLEPRDLRVRSWGNIAEGTTFNRVFRAGQVLFGKRRAYQRKAAVAHFDGLCSGDIYVFAANEERLVPELLPFLVQTEGFAAHAENTSEGSLSPRTKWKYLAEYEFALPGDPAEQRRIADLLRAADDAVEAWRTAVEQEESLMESLVHDLLNSANGKRVKTFRTSELLLTPVQNGVSPNPNSSGEGVPSIALSAVISLLTDTLSTSSSKNVTRSDSRFNPTICTWFAAMAVRNLSVNVQE